MPYRICLLTAALGLMFSCASTQYAGAEDELVPMFNGTDFDGWVLTNTPPETWSYQDGMVICSGKPIGEIRTAKMYQNFVMELEWRHMVPRGNAGVFVWADDITARGVPFHRGIEVQVLENAYGNNRSHTTHGDIFPIHGAKMTPINGRGGSRAFPTENRSNPSPEWNHYRIECRDGEISLAVNGKVVTKGKDCIPRKGYICLESEGGIVHYRNVKICELPATEISPDQVAIADRGYQSLYSGLNLDGWQPAEQPSAWKSKDWVLAFEGTEQQTGRLSSSETFENVGVVVDVRLKEASSKAVVHIGDTASIDLASPDVADHLEKTGRWNRIEGIYRDGGFSWVVNGEPIPAKSPYSDVSGQLILEATGPVDFCNLYAQTRDPQ